MYLAIDIGGTKTLLALMSNKNKLLRRRRFLTNKDQLAFYKDLEHNLSSLKTPKSLKAITIAVPGPVENGHVLWFGNLPWTDFNPFPILRKLFPKIPVFLENDANLAGLSEAEGLPGLSVYLTFSTGIGGGVIRDGKIDPSLATYEPGHDKYIWNGEATEWEDFAAASAISRDYKKLATKIRGKKNWADVANRISFGIASIISSTHPETIIIGGPLALTFPKYKEYLIAELKKSMSPGIPFPRLKKAIHPKTAVVYGCALYAKGRLAQN